jgi:anhydro-N-acetylmuramic acid kinase
MSTTVLGLMSGTSADGIDAVLVRFAGRPESPSWQILASSFRPYPDALRTRLLEAGQGALLSSAEWLELGEALTEEQAAAARQCDPAGTADLIGCHGQTVWHRPPQSQCRGASWQLLQGPLLARLLDRPVICDFRAADLSLGGQGAPLVPPADQSLVGRLAGWRALLNLGGIANLTLIPPACGPDRHAPLQGWDCGPANTLVDLAVSHFSAGRLSFDADGEWAGRGTVDESTLQGWLEEPYFQQCPPKSTGRELFGAADLQRRLARLEQASGLRGRSLNAADALATLTAFSAAVVAQDLCRGPCPVELLVAGGGSRNRTLMHQLRHRCPGITVRPLQELGIADNQREALAFALLAWWHRLGHPGNAPSVTGAAHACVLGIAVEPPTHPGRYNRRRRGAPRSRC